MMDISLSRALLFGAAALGFCAGASAQAGGESDGWSVSLGAGLLTSPTYEGDDAYDLKLLPNIQIRHGDRFFASVQEGAGYRLFHSEDFSLGPLVKIAFGRDEDGDQTFSLTGGETDDLLGLGDIDTAAEVGGFVEWSVGNIRLGAEIRQALGGHEGAVAELGARYGGRVTGFGPPVFWSVGPRVKITDGTYTASYFGVDAGQALASGLPEYDAGGGGLYSWGIGASAVVPLDREGRWTLVGIFGYDRLTGDAGDAPLVQLRGSADQAVAGLFLSRTFR